VQAFVKNLHKLLRDPVRRCSRAGQTSPGAAVSTVTNDRALVRYRGRSGLRRPARGCPFAWCSTWTMGMLACSASAAVPAMAFGAQRLKSAFPMLSRARENASGFQ